MRILILCDIESSSYDGLDLRTQVQMAVQKTKNEAKVIILNGDEINPCLGCFNCWVKTPGLCIMTDDCANTIAGEEIQSDAIIILSKIIYGGYSYDIKAFLDRSIPNISPFFEIVEGEMHHKMRYDRFPYMITIGYGPYTPDELQTFTSLAERNALNMRPPKHFVLSIQSSDKIEEAMQTLENILSQEVK